MRAMSGRLHNLVAAAVLLAVLTLPGASVAWAQATPKELRQEMDARMSAGEYLDAIPAIEQLIVYLGESKDPGIRASMEIVFFNLGLCHFFSGQLGESEQGFRNYLKKYPRTVRSGYAAVYIADCQRFQGNLSKAMASYKDAVRSYRFRGDMIADIYSAIARIHLLEDEWEEAIRPLKIVYLKAPDFLRRNWAATMLATAYFKTLDIDNIYPMTPFLLRKNSFASRSVASNLAALEAGDDLFAQELYRDALWIFRMVYPYDSVMVKAEEYLEWLELEAERVRKDLTDPRRLMRLQAQIGELEEELKALEQIPNYDVELFFRIARGYMEMMRYWEGRELFLYLHGITQDRESEEALYLAFVCSSNLLPWDRA
jgi:hypothetical protein